MTQSPTPIFERIQRFAVLWLVFVSAFVLGIYLYDRELWPYQLVQDGKAFLEGNQDEELGVADKLRNDLGGVPARHLITPREPFDQSRTYQVLTGLPLIADRAMPDVFLSPTAPRGYRLIHGTFAFDSTLHGAILLSPDGKLLRHWPITQADVSWNHRADTNVVPHGIDITRDGSIIFAFDAGTSIRRVSWCNDVEWITMGGFHHSVDMNEDDALWSWGQVSQDAPYGRNMIRLDPVKGEVLQSIHLDDVIKANPDIDIFGIRQKDNNHRSVNAHDPWHVNDVEALSEAQAAAYPGFSPGDLLVSLRSPNLVFVFDPQSLKVKWWRQGLVRRQHDPDFNPRGTISVYDNNMHRGLSRIVDIDPNSYAHETVIAGEGYDFYSWRRGKHQEMPDGGWLVTSTEQGRVFETAPDGQIRFEFLNRFDEQRFLPVSEAMFLPEGWFKDLPNCGDGA